MIPAPRSGFPPAVDLRRLAFVDVETTGLDAVADRIAEIGVVTVDGDEVADWGSFVAPKRGAGPRPPRRSPLRVALPDTAPTFRDIAAELQRRLAGRLFIAHNARFDYAFLKSEFERAGIAFDAQVVCTVMLSRKLYPQSPAHDLDALIDRHGLACVERHRALPDARALAAGWFAIAREQGRERLAGTVAQLLAGPVLPSHLDPALVDRLPESPGVYVFHGGADEILRIGAARRLRAHLTSYFRLDRASPRALAMSQRIETITWHATQGMLGARLRAIALQRAGPERRKSGSPQVLSWCARPERHPCLELTQIEGESFAENATERFGMFASERKARNALARLARRHALCHALLGLSRSPDARCDACDDDGGVCGERMQRLRHLVKCFAALRPLRIAPWPYSGPIVVRERSDLHVFDEWRHLGTARTESEVLEAASARQTCEFDAAVYACLRRSLPRIAASDQILPVNRAAARAERRAPPLSRVSVRSAVGRPEDGRG